MFCCLIAFYNKNTYLNLKYKHYIIETQSMCMCICTHTWLQARIKCPNTCYNKQCRPILKCMENDKESYDKTSMQLKFKYWYVYIYLCLFLSLGAQVICTALLFTSVSIIRQSVGGFGRVISPSQSRYLHRTNVDKHPWFELNSNSWSQRSIAQPLWSAVGIW
jgi:hypothetical protein